MTENSLYASQKVLKMGRIINLVQFIEADYHLFREDLSHMFKLTFRGLI